VDPRRATEPLPDPLFPGARFATPFFLDVGRDGRPPQPAPHETDAYVYAVSNDGYWDNGNALHLARVRRADLPKLDLASWEFFCGCREAGATPVWRPGKPGLEACYPILSAPFAFGQTGMVYIAPLQRYLLVGWRYPILDRDTWNVRTSVWDFYEAEAPWGPWRLVGSKRWEGEGFYNPGIPARFVSGDGRRLWALTAGNFDTWNAPPETTLYTLSRADHARRGLNGSDARAGESLGRAPRPRRSRRSAPRPSPRSPPRARREESSCIA
jgi:hypothetical protein